MPGSPIPAHAVRAASCYPFLPPCHSRTGPDRIWRGVRRVSTVSGSFSFLCPGFPWQDNSPGTPNRSVASPVLHEVSHPHVLPSSVVSGAVHIQPAPFYVLS